MALFDTIEDFRKEVRKALGGVNDDGNPALSQTEIRNSLEFICGMNIRMEGSQMPDATSLPKQNGWKFADKMLEEAADNDNFPTMGELTGVITLKS